MWKRRQKSSEPAKIWPIEVKDDDDYLTLLAKLAYMTQGDDPVHPRVRKILEDQGAWPADAPPNPQTWNSTR